LLVLSDNSVHNIALHRSLNDSGWEARGDGVLNTLRGPLSVFGWSKNVSGMRGLTASFAYLFAAASIFLGAQATAITFDDGLIHVIDAGNSFPFDQVLVEDGPGSTPTTVNVVAGGEVATLIPGGAPGLRAFENSIINVSGAVIGVNLDALNNSVVNISGGLIERTLQVSGTSTATISGGRIDFSMIVGVTAPGYVDISGGEIGGAVSGLSVTGGLVNISGGVLSELHTEHSAEVNVSGGTFTRDADTRDDSVLFIEGGAWSGPITVTCPSFSYQSLC
jgi:hypothetical protein